MSCHMRYDCLLSEILEERKSLAGFLDAIFGFLSRKTDFYHIQKGKDEELGFPRGIKEEILFSCMQKYEKDHNDQEHLPEHYGEEPPPAIKEVEVETDCCETPTEQPTAGVEISEPPITNYEVGLTSEKAVVTFSANDYRNGAILDKYCWSQTLKDIEISVLLPDQVRSGKHVKLDLKSNSISIKSLLPNEHELVSGETWAKYKHKDVVWTIADGRLILSCDKLKETWWDKLFVHEECIDIKKLDTDCAIEEYSEDTQRAIERAQRMDMAQEDLKDIPLSESEQLSRLKLAWNAENSPFKGRPFDPSVIHFD